MATRTYLSDWRSPQEGEYASAVEVELLDSGRLFSATVYPAARGRCSVTVEADEAAHAFILTIPGVSEVI